MKHPSSVPSPSLPERHVVQVDAADKDVTKIVRALSREYGGIGTHYKGHTRYCAGDDCPRDLHRLEWYYRGYFAAERYDEGSKLWLPCVWELTEQAELDVREEYARGVVWEMYLEKVTGKRHPPARAKRYGAYPEASLPAEWDYRGVLQRMYHVRVMHFDVRNPMPPRLALIPSPFTEGIVREDSSGVKPLESHEERMAHWQKLRNPAADGVVASKNGQK